KYCLCYEDGIDLKHILRETGANSMMSGQQLLFAFREAVSRKPVAHCFETPDRISEQHEMSRIGG
ncbi:MAG: GTP 3',8-cyclase MoaA, partial [Eubacteriales bacterium]|nr:GTP 3',8-cyclase MoaA [Eubacteriales bacterium]